MSILINDNGFHSDKNSRESISLADWCARGDQTLLDSSILDLLGTTDPNTIPQSALAFAMIRVAFTAFNDGRGFTVARALRLQGYQGHLRACGLVLPDQYSMLRRVGFDDVQISDDWAKRHTEAYWQQRTDWQVLDYQTALRAKSARATTPSKNP